MNALAGGGSFVSLPALISVGVPVAANEGRRFDPLQGGRRKQRILLAPPWGRFSCACGRRGVDERRVGPTPSVHYYRTVPAQPSSPGMPAGSGEQLSSQFCRWPGGTPLTFRPGRHRAP
jgi:hypothetical protein